MIDQNEKGRIAETRQSFTGQTLTEAQFEESWAITGIIERGIRRTGTFKEKLGDYAYAFARTERFDAMKAETIVRDIFKERYGQTMNQMREALMERESGMMETAGAEALGHAQKIERLIKEGDTMPFYRAYDREAAALARNFNITEAGAKSLMKQVYQAAVARDLYEVGKEAEREYHMPKKAKDALSRQVEEPRQRPIERTR